MDFPEIGYPGPETGTMTPTEVSKVVGSSGMDRRAWGRVCLFLGLIVAVEVVALVDPRSRGHLVDVLPVALYPAAIYSARGGYRITTAVLAAVVGAVPLVLTQHDPVGAVARSVTLAVASWIVARIVDEERWRGVPSVLRVARLIFGCFIGSVVGAAGFAIANIGGGHAWWVVALTAGLNQLAAYLIVVPFFLPSLHAGSRSERHGVEAVERDARWTVLAVASVLAFGPVDVPYGVMTLLPVVTWTALRGTMREALWQMIWVDVITVGATIYGRGPLTAAHFSSAQPGVAWLAPELFVLACTFVCVPFCMMVNLERGTALQAAHAALWTSRLLDSVDGICIIGSDADGLIDTFNPGAERILGYGQEDVIGRSPGMFLTEDEIVRLANRFDCPARYEAVAREVAQRSQDGGIDIEFVRKDGEVRILSVVLTSVRDDRGTQIGHVVTAEDVTERVRTQAALKEAVRIESDAVARLRDVDRVKETFVSSVSHELRTPITNIVGYLKMLADGMYGELTGEQYAALERVEQNSRRLLTLIDDLLTMSNVEDFGVELDVEHLDLRKVVAVRRRFPARPHRASAQTRRRAARRAGRDPRRPADLKRLVTNLVRNAIKFTPDGGSISVSLRGRTPWWCLEVSDTGMGIPADELPMLFNRFYRSANADKAAIQGSGLGLSIALKIAERHNARITVDSAVGFGSTFRVESMDAPPPR